MGGVFGGIGQDLGLLVFVRAPLRWVTGIGRALWICKVDGWELLGISTCK